MTVVRGRTLDGALGRAVGRALDELEALELADRFTLAAGADDPLLPGPDAVRPLVVVPALGPGRPTPWALALIEAADAVVVLDPVEAVALGDAVQGRPVIAAGLPRPPAAPEGGGLQVGEVAGPALLAAWRLHGEEPPGAAGVAWVGGEGASPLAQAMEAWAAGRAVVTLPGAPRHELLRRGGALRAESVAEVLEATGYLLRNAALARVLGQRGRQVVRRRPAPREVAWAMVEALEVARQSRAGVP